MVAFMDKVTTAQIHPEIACSKLLRTDKKIPTAKRRRIFLCRLVLTPRPWAYMGLVVVVIMIATHRQIVLDAFLLPALGLFVDLVLCRNEDKRAMSARFHNVAEGNILRLCDSADISPPGAA